MLSPATIKELESKCRQIYHEHPKSKAEQSISDRIRRALSWLQRSIDLPSGDKPPRLIDLWIALNALYGVVTYTKKNTPQREADQFADFLQRLSKLDTKKHIFQLVQNTEFKENCLGIIENKYLWKEFWRNDASSYKKEVAKELAKAKEHYGLSPQMDIPFLVSLFKRLSILRNQIMHGSSSASTDRNKDALIPAIYVLETMRPIFIEILLSIEGIVDWPDVPYPRKGSPQHPK